MNAFRLTSLQDIKVVIIGQDPYHQPHQAMGLSFSVPSNVRLPKSLINIYKELYDDLGINNKSGDLTAWAKQGVFLLNTTLTVRENEPMSHVGQGWEIFTRNMIEVICQQPRKIVFVLWGKHAQQFEPLVSQYGHAVIASVHPSPLSASRGFFGSRPFSRINQILEQNGQAPIDWRTDHV